MLQNALQFSQILRYVNQYWYIGENINSKQLSEFLFVQNGCKRKYIQKSKMVTFFTQCYVSVMLVN